MTRAERAAWLKRLREAIQAKFGTTPDQRIGIRSGFPEFDRVTRGFHQRKLYVAAGRPGGGKTSWATSIMANIALFNRNQGVLCISTELNEEEIIMQIVEAYAGGVPIYPNDRRSSEDEIVRLEAALGEVMKQVEYGLLRVVYHKRLTVRLLHELISTHCDKALDGAAAFVIIDQASRIHRDDKNKHGYAIATEHMLNELEVMAEQQDVPVLLLTQLNRMTEMQKTPSMANLKHSGAFEEFAHAVFLFQLEDAHGQRRPGSAFVEWGARVHVAKNRHGRKGPIDFVFWGECHTWREVDREHGKETA